MPAAIRQIGFGGTPLWGFDPTNIAALWAGFLGSAAVRELRKRDLPVRCLVRETSDTSKLEDLDVELIAGDLRDASSVQKAFKDVTAVISSFAINISEDRRVTSLWQNDYEGNLHLIKSAQQAGVKKFIFISYWGLAKFSAFEHGKIKKMVEDLLTISGLNYTVFRVTTLATDMSQLLGESLKRKRWSPILMKPHEKIRPILLEDLAWCIADALTNPKAEEKIIEVAGQEEYTFLELRDLFSHAIGRKVRFLFVPLGLANFIAASIDFATGNRNNIKGLVSAFTGGSTCDIAEMEKIFQLQQGSFAKHLEDYFSTGAVVEQSPRPMPHFD